MPLTPSQKVALALRITAARFLDPECCGLDDEAAYDSRKAASSALNTLALEAKVRIVEDAEIPDFVRGSVVQLQQYPSLNGALAVGVSALTNYVEGLVGFCGDGRVAGGGIDLNQCRSGLLELAGLLELETRKKISAAEIALSERSEISFTTNMAANPAMLAPMRVNGVADISQEPRLIDITLCDDALSAEDIVTFAYVILHELVCHGFQASLSTEGAENAPPKCCWSEGWMDALAFDLAVHWIWNGPAEWVPLQGERAIAALRAAHDARYSAESRLASSDRSRRNHVRNAYRLLGLKMVNFGYARSSDEAADLVHRFSWTLQTHEAFDSKTVRKLALRLSAVLCSNKRVEEHPSVVLGCLEFIRHRDILILDTIIPSA